MIRNSFILLIFVHFCMLSGCRQLITNDYELKTAKKISGYWRAEIPQFPGVDAGRFYFWYTLDNEWGENSVTYTYGETRVNFMNNFIGSNNYLIGTRWWINDKKLYLGSTVDYLVLDIVKLKNDFVELRHGNENVYLYRISDF